MTIGNKITDEKLQYDINREAAKISALTSGKIDKYDINREATKISALSSSKSDKYEYLTGEEVLPPSQSRIIEQTKFTYSPIGKALEKQIKTIEHKGKK